MTKNQNMEQKKLVYLASPYIQFAPRQFASKLALLSASAIFGCAIYTVRASAIASKLALLSASAYICRLWERKRNGY